MTQSLDNFKKVLENSPSMLPIARKIAAQTIGLDLVSVVPMNGGNTSDELNRIKKEINRDNKIKSIIDEDYTESKIEDHPDYIKPNGPRSELFYIDYEYGSPTQSTKSI